MRHDEQYFCAVQRSHSNDGRFSRDDLVTGARAADGVVVTRSGCLSQALRECGEAFWSAKRHAIGKISYLILNAGSRPRRRAVARRAFSSRPPSALFAAAARNNSSQSDQASRPTVIAPLTFREGRRGTSYRQRNITVGVRCCRGEAFGKVIRRSGLGSRLRTDSGGRSRRYLRPR
jgi:hypothetical protein